MVKLLQSFRVHKIEGVMTKQADNTNFGFPIKDDIGRLQIIKSSDLEELREYWVQEHLE